MSKKPFSETKVGRFINERVKPVAGDVLEFVGEVTGVEAIDRVGEFLNAKKEEDAQIAALAHEFEKFKAEMELEFRKLEIEELRIEVQDRTSARSREIDFMKANGGKRDWLMGTSVMVALLMYVATFVFLAYGPAVNPDKKDLFNMAVGQVFTFVGMVFAYYLGTTRSSRQKDDTISKAIGK